MTSKNLSDILDCNNVINVLSLLILWWFDIEYRLCPLAGHNFFTIIKYSMPLLVGDQDWD